MTTKAHITSDFATPNDVASRLRIPAARAAELRRQLFDLHVTNPDGSITIVELKKIGAGKTRKTALPARSKKK
jgi:hypothetical protein